MSFSRGGPSEGEDTIPNRRTLFLPTLGPNMDRGRLVWTYVSRGGYVMVTHGINTEECLDIFRGD